MQLHDYSYADVSMGSRVLGKSVWELSHSVATIRAVRQDGAVTCLPIMPDYEHVIHQYGLDIGMDFRRNLFPVKTSALSYALYINDVPAITYVIIRAWTSYIRARVHGLLQVDDLLDHFIPCLLSIYHFAAVEYFDHQHIDCAGSSILTVAANAVMEWSHSEDVAPA